MTVWYSDASAATSSLLLPLMCHDVCVEMRCTWTNIYLIYWHGKHFVCSLAHAFHENGFFCVQLICAHTSMHYTLWDTHKKEAHIDHKRQQHQSTRKQSQTEKESFFRKQNERNANRQFRFGEGIATFAYYIHLYRLIYKYMSSRMRMPNKRTLMHAHHTLWFWFGLLCFSSSLLQSLDVAHTRTQANIRWSIFISQKSARSYANG